MHEKYARCAKFFFEEEINAAMTALEDTLGIRLRKRYNKGEDINVKHVTDLYDKLFSLDASSTPIQFLAADITRVPSAEWKQDNSNSLASPEQLSSIFSLRRIVAQLQSQMVSRDFLEASISQICGSNRNGVIGVVATSLPLQSSPSEYLLGAEFPPLLPPPPHMTPFTPTAPEDSQPSIHAGDAGQLSAVYASAPHSFAATASSSAASSSAASSAASSLATSATDSTASSDSTSSTSLSGSRRKEVVDRQGGKVGRKPQPTGASGTSGASGAKQTNTLKTR